MKFIPDAIGRAIAERGLLASENAPKILFGIGVVGMIGSTILACRATLKLDEELSTIERDIFVAKAVNQDPSVSESEHSRDLATAYTHGAFRVVKLYAPSVILGAASIAALTKSHNILQDRNLALTAAYAAVDGAFQRYRGRVIDRYGEETDRDLLYESEAVDILDEETGKIVSTTQITDAPGSVYARWYDEYSSRNWSRDPDVNLLFLRSKQNYLNDRLRARGHVFLNEVYDELGLTHTTPGSVVGWRWNKDSGDDHIDFLRDVDRGFFNGREGSILLDFNVDGVIYNKIEEDL